MQIMQIHFAGNIIVECVCVLAGRRPHFIRDALAFGSTNIVQCKSGESSCRFDIEITSAFLDGANYTFCDALPRSPMSFDQSIRSCVRFIMDILANERALHFDSVLVWIGFVVFRIEWPSECRRSE